MPYFIFCQVDGGVTGTRRAFLKGDDGVTRVFENLESARLECERLTNLMNHQRSQARFTYRPYEKET